ncbi:MAG: hypothetical protein IPO95_14185 [Rhodanobacteraceae bacterium]|nr:hypothetical protein [Rhodanobacteraceae bacterium]MBL0041597.1 hypothetical protein [Xanthomonadales bacterium]MBP6078059.1 hypothetical protein [Xanthomonadales bacterium]MBP7622561.1 hypothetical protein [Xanthomonadales bacterium]
MTDTADRLHGLLRDLHRARHPEHEPRNRLPQLPRLRRWQSARLGRSFGSLREHPRYGNAAEFFLSDLYSAEDVSWRDRDLARVLPTMLRWLPNGVLGSLADALELDLISVRCDLALVEHLPAGEIDVGAYARAYRASIDAEQRRRQIALIGNVGRELEAIVRKPFVLGVLKLARGPARGAGFGELQTFLERGFSAFRAMGPADEFLATITDGETTAMQRLLSAHPDPFGFELRA